MLAQRRLVWTVRFAAMDARAQMGNPSLALATGALIAFIPTVVLGGFDWEHGIEAALLGALVGYSITFLRLVIATSLEYWRNGHPHFETDVYLEGGSLSMRIRLKDGASPQGVNELGVLVRRRGESGHGVLLPGVYGTYTIDRVGFIRPAVRYPDDFPDAPALESGVWQVIWSDIRRGKRREFLFHEETGKIQPPHKTDGSQDGTEDDSSQ